MIRKTTSKTLAVCGDSWFSSDLKFPGQSFGEVLSAKKNWNLLSLARGGCSNFAIALQIDKAIELTADFIIVGVTTADRIEFPIISNENKSIWKNLKSKFNWSEWWTAQPRTYDRKNGLANVQYSLHPDLSSLHEFLINPTVISESLNNIAFNQTNYSPLLVPEQIEALKLYMLNLYDFELKSQVDSWIISDACRRLIDSNIPFLIDIRSLTCQHELSWVPDKNKLSNLENIFKSDNKELSSARFHYQPSDAVVIADRLYKKLKLLIDN